MPDQLNLPFLIHACCIPVKGFTKSIVYDINRCSFDYIPNDLFAIMHAKEGSTISEIKQEHDHEDGNIIEEYFEFLLDKEYMFFCDDKEEMQQFPKIDRGFEFPGVLSNAILQFDYSTDYDLNPVLMQLNALGCRDIQLVFYKYLTADSLSSVLDKFQTSSFKCIEVLLPFTEFATEETLSTISDRYKRLSRLYIFRSPFNRVLRTTNRLPEIIFSKESISRDLYYAVNSVALFKITPDLFWESLQFNPYLNGKICIDPAGNIKNAPNSDLIYGNIRDSKLNDIVNSPSFKTLWRSRKDEIPTCRDCEYRYMCIDGRIPTRKAEVWEHQISCGYDVYNGKWAKE